MRQTEESSRQSFMANGAMSATIQQDLSLLSDAQIDEIAQSQKIFSPYAELDQSRAATEKDRRAEKAMSEENEESNVANKISTLAMAMLMALRSRRGKPVRMAEFVRRAVRVALTAVKTADTTKLAQEIAIAESELTAQAELLFDAPVRPEELLDGSQDIENIEASARGSTSPFAPPQAVVAAANETREALEEAPETDPMTTLVTAMVLGSSSSVPEPAPVVEEAVSIEEWNDDIIETLKPAAASAIPLSQINKAQSKAEAVPAQADLNNEDDLLDAEEEAGWQDKLHGQVQIRKFPVKTRTAGSALKTDQEDADLSHRCDDKVMAGSLRELEELHDLLLMMEVEAPAQQEDWSSLKTPPQQAQGQSWITMQWVTQDTSPPQKTSSGIDGQSLPKILHHAPNPQTRREKTPIKLSNLLIEPVGMRQNMIIERKQVPLTPPTGQDNKASIVGRIKKDLLKKTLKTTKAAGHKISDQTEQTDDDFLSSSEPPRPPSSPKGSL